MKFISYAIFRLITYGFALIPFWLLYRFSDILTFLFFFVLPYRKKVILKNIAASFPEKSIRERKRICYEFYRNFSDILLEGVKGHTLSKKTILKHCGYKDLELLTPFFEQGKSIVITAGHLGNWEWAIPVSGLVLQHRAICLYKPLSNEYFDRFMFRMRSFWQIEMVSIYETREAFKSFEAQPTAVIMIADQSPTADNLLYWTQFLGQKTAFLIGPEKYAKRLNAPVIYFAVERISRGQYEITAELISDDPQKEKEFAITDKYIAALETQIQKNPENWLWSHNRWKLKEA